MWWAYLETKLLPFMSDDQNTKPLVPSPGVTQRLLPTRVGGLGVSLRVAIGRAMRGSLGKGTRSDQWSER